MARKKRNEVLVGVLTVVGLGLFLLLIFLMGGLDQVLERRSTVEVEFADVQGLKIGDPVYLFGLKVGFVSDIRIADDPEGAPVPARLIVSADVPAKFRGRVRTTSRVRIDKSITGSLSVLIQESEDGTGPRLAEGDTLRGKPTPALGELTADFGRVLAEGREIADEVRAIVAGIRQEGNLSATLAHFHEIASTLRERTSPLLEHLDEATRTLNESTASLRDLLRANSEPLTRTLARLDETTAAIERIFRDLETTPAKIEAGLAALEGAGTSITSLLDENRAGVRSVVEDLTEAMASASNLAAEIKRRPWRLLYKPDLDEQKALELYDAAWAYNLGATELHRSVRLLTHHLEEAGGGAAGSGTGGQDEVVREAIARVERSLARQKEAEEAFWTRLAKAR